MDVSICIVNLSNIRYLKPCIESIYQHTRGVTFEIIVTDKNSTDGSVEILEREFPQVKVLTGDINKGFTANMNMALREARGRHVVIFNDDTLLISNAFAEMVAFLDAHPQYGAVGPRLLNIDGSFQLGPRGPATIWTLTWNEFKLDTFFPKSRVFGAFYMKYWDPNEPCEMVTASGACMVVRREVFQQVGLLEEGIAMGPDDVEFSIRVRQAGWKLYYLANVSIIHYGEASKKRSQVESMIRMYKGWFWFLGHQYGWLHAHGYRLVAGLGALVRIAGWLVIYMARLDRRAYALERIRGRWGILRLSLSPSLKQSVIAGT